MTLVRYNNWFPKFFDDNFVKELDQWFGNQPGSSLPAVNVKEDEHAYQLEVAVPGMNKDDFRVELDHDVLRIAAHREEKNEDKDQQGKYTRREFRSRSFQRSFRLPENGIKSDQIEARYENGVLYLNLPKQEALKPQAARAIEVA